MIIKEIGISLYRKVGQLVDSIAKHGYSIYRIFDNGNIGKLTDKQWPQRMFDCLAVAPGANIPSNLIIEK